MPIISTKGAASSQGVGEFNYKKAASAYIEDVFSTYLYTGNGSTQTITNGINLSGKGGLVWFKYRAGPNGPANHQLYDTARGVQKKLATNTTEAEATELTGLTAFNANGFSFGSDGNINASSSDTYASWTFRKQPKFFDVVTFTSPPTGGTDFYVNHSLESVPGCVIIKRLGAFEEWVVCHRGIANSARNLLILNSSSAVLSSGVDGYIPTSTNVMLRTGTTVSGGSVQYVMYLFAHNAGGFGDSGSDNVITCGSYTGNNSATAGPTITLGYEPQWILIKRSNSAADWIMYDNMRGLPVGGNSSYLYANTFNAEASASWNRVVSPLATGFQIATSDAYLNANGGTYIYIAIRRGPMKTPTTGTSVFDADAWTGNNTAGRNIPTGFPVDLTIAQIRTASPNTQANLWWDRLRGYGSTSSITGNYLRSQNKESEGALADYMYIPTMNGFNFGSVANNSNQYNSPNVTAVGWNFRRAPGFFDVVCYTGTGAGQTVNHNLGVIPELIILKNRLSASTDWPVKCPIGLTNTGVVYLNLDLANATGVWETGDTSTTFKTRSTSNLFYNQSGQTYVAYLFATVAGVSKVGSYTGTGTTLQVNCGFTGGARFVLIKRTDSTGDWYVWDSARGIVSGNDPYLLLNSTAAEVTNTDYVDTYAQGFEISSTAPAAINANGGTYIFLAIA